MSSPSFWIVLLAGASTGALVTMAGNLFLKFFEWRREDRGRFLADRREAYANCLALLETYWFAYADLSSAYSRVYEAKERNEAGEIPADLINKVESLFADAIKVLGDLRHASGVVELIAPPYVWEALDGLVERVTTMLFKVGFDKSGEGRPHSDGYPRAERAKFVAAARRDLGLSEDKKSDPTIASSGRDTLERAARTGG